MAQPGEQSTAAEDAKKKTKLGYHRQSIACVFCRRRKIRCTITDQDSGKCDTCFKLGKDCQFLKVNDAIALDHVTPIKRNKRALSLGHAKSQGQSWPHEHDDRAYESSPMQPPQRGRIVFTRDVYRPNARQQQQREDWSEPLPAQSAMPLQRPRLPHRYTDPAFNLTNVDADFGEQMQYNQEAVASPMPTPTEMTAEAYFGSQPYFVNEEPFAVADQRMAYTRSNLDMARSASQPYDGQSPYYSEATSERSRSIDGRPISHPDEAMYGVPPEMMAINAMGAFEADLYQQYQGISSRSSPLQYPITATASSIDDYGRQQSPFTLEQNFGMRSQSQPQHARQSPGLPVYAMQPAHIQAQPPMQSQQPQPFEMTQGQSSHSARTISGDQPFIHYNPRGNGRGHRSR